MEQADCKLTEIDMCTAIISGVSQDLATVYWAAKGTYLTLRVKILLADMAPMELAVNATKANIDKIVSKAAGLTPLIKARDQRIKYKGPTAATCRIPCKTQV